VNIVEDGYYSFASNTTIGPYGYIYKSHFNPFDPSMNLIGSDDQKGCENQFKLITYLEASTTYILVVTTYYPNKTGPFSIIALGPNNITLKRSSEFLTEEIPILFTIVLAKTHSSCFVGSKCRFYDKSIGLTLDDILRDEIRWNTTLNNQSFTVKMSVALIMIMFIGGLINGVLSCLTFQDKELRETGCGMYLLASSITSIVTISMLTVKFWFVVVTHMNVSVTLSVLQGGCVSIEPILKLFVYLDTWLNACVAIERAINVSKGINFDRAKSKRIARWMIIILPFCIMSSIIHEPLKRELFEYKTEIKETSKDTKEEDTKEGVTRKNNAWCITRYSRSVEKYNTAILFFHLFAPFAINLFSALFIIFGVARQRSIAQPKRSYREHVHKQLDEHKQLVVSPLVMAVLSSPRLIIALLPGCVNVSRNPWLYLFAYFISFTPSMLVFMIFVLPSKLYKKKFKELFRT
jgi:hypothetical protein